MVQGRLIALADDGTIVIRTEEVNEAPAFSCVLARIFAIRFASI